MQVDTPPVGIVRRGGIRSGQAHLHQSGTDQMTNGHPKKTTDGIAAAQAWYVTRRPAPAEVTFDHEDLSDAELEAIRKQVDPDGDLEKRLRVIEGPAW